MTQDEIKQIVKETIDELKRQGILRQHTELSYAEVTSILSAYYKEGQNDSTIRKALKDLESDPYYKIIPLYFDYGYTHEKLAEVFDCDPSTIARNRKRLCLQIYSVIS